MWTLTFYCINITMRRKFSLILSKLIPALREWWTVVLYLIHRKLTENEYIVSNENSQRPCVEQRGYLYKMGGNGSIIPGTMDGNYEKWTYFIQKSIKLLIISIKWIYCTLWNCHICIWHNSTYIASEMDGNIWMSIFLQNCIYIFDAFCHYIYLFVLFYIWSVKGMRQ